MFRVAGNLTAFTNLDTDLYAPGSQFVYSITETLCRVYSLTNNTLSSR